MPSSQSAHWLLSLSLGYVKGSAQYYGLRSAGWSVAGARCCLAAVLTQAPHATMSTTASEPRKLKKLLVANRGEIACRVLTTARKMGIASVAVYSEADRLAKHVELADESYCIGGAAARDSYLRTDVILDIARRTGADAVHPGYGFLSENAAFAEACAAAGAVFVGPPASAIRSMGDKSAAKAIMQAAGVPVVPGYHGEDQSEERLVSEAHAVGFPLLVKAVSGGGGKGMKLAEGPGELLGAIRSARREALSSFSDDRLLLERYISRPRHVEVQVFADTHGNAVYLYDRDCSMQRRHQKVIEEAPAPGLSEQFHRHLGEAAVRAARAVGYVNAGTVEFIVDTDRLGQPQGGRAGGQEGGGGEEQEQAFYFMEMNTRLQVEHPVTEAITGQDLVSWQLAVAGGAPLPASQQEVAAAVARGGHAVEARIYAEDPRNGFLPGAGRVRRWRTPRGSTSFQLGGVRVDSGVREGDRVGTYYDPLIAKLVVHCPPPASGSSSEGGSEAGGREGAGSSSREAALRGLERALGEIQVSGLPTNIPFLRRLAAHPGLLSAAPAELNTAFIARHREELLRPQEVPGEVAALAAVARHLLTVRKQAAAEAAEGLTSRLGPWGAAAAVPLADGGPAGGGGAAGVSGFDSVRLWHKHRRTFAVRHPEGGEGAEMVASLTVLGGGDFEVQSKMQNTAAGPPPPPPAGAAAAMTMTVRCARLTTDDSGDDDVSSGDGRRGMSSSTNGHVLTAEVNGRRCTAHVMLYGSTDDEAEGGWGAPVTSSLDLWMAGEHYHFTWTEPTWSRKAGAAAAAAAAAGGGGSAAAGAAGGVRGAVVSPMPGRVVAVMVAEGDRVKAGDPLVALEAMKMEHAVAARRGGVVRQVAVAAGGQVGQGQLLVLLGEEEGEKII
ncbi:hypothetical protein Agub_g4560 [Astrephomene gubernaculifera]|uniref:Uncharacterized protein n=1 Tax=Astrephomene gubernaculifera TaxID=47775 RepID=A0AAD3HK21_9CHLO|nr:hypothetical protein Agub_g4560 [Astrephomene gubernaculifera]